MSAIPNGEPKTQEGWGAAPGSSSIDGINGSTGFPSSRSTGSYDPRSGGQALHGMGTLNVAPPGFNAGEGNKPGLDGNSALSWSGQEDASQGVGRTNSFTNLAAALGSGLAESMDDATKGEHTKSMLTDNFLLNGKEDISYARHSRHVASRILGVGQGGQGEEGFGNHKAAEAGSLFSFDSGDHTSQQRSNGVASDVFVPSFSKDRDGKSMDPSTRLPASTFHPSNHDPVPGYNSGPKQGSFDNHGNIQLSNPGHGQDVTYELQRDMQNLWSGRDTQTQPLPSPGPGNNPGEKSPIDVQTEAEEELRAFTWDVRHHDASRSLAIMHAASLSASDIRSICETYGAIENFRSDFVEKGIFFVSFYDMRCAQYAAMELQPRLKKLGPSAERVRVQFCVPLNSSSQNDESLVLLMDVPQDLNIESLAAMLSSYGAVRSLKSIGGNYGGNSFVVEYHDVQDAKQALLELESTQQFGPNVSVEVGARNPSDRKRGRDLLALIGRWRHGGASQGPNSRQPHIPVDAGRYGRHTPPRGMGHHPEMGRYEGSGPNGREQAPQLVLGPDGRYTYMVVNHSNYPLQGGIPSQYGDRAVHPGHGSTYVTHVNPSNHHQYWQPQTHHFSSSGSVVSQSSYADSHHSGHYPNGTQSLPYFRGDGSVGSHSHHSHHSHRVSVASNGTMGTNGDNQHLVMDLDAVENGRDSRTSLMVRNIPNKYTQQMLLNEFTENGHGPGTIDFFYLPIDFKNRCNRGYAFINFVDFRDILAFHRRYFGKHWRTFNSDKICDITYARIQGKSAMLKRFENSALMEKDDEYKPLVFVSNGPDKGTRLPFPSSGK